MKIRLLWALLSWLSLLSYGARAQTNVTLARETFEGLNTDQGYTSGFTTATTAIPQDNSRYFERRMFASTTGSTTYPGIGTPGPGQTVSNQQGSYAWTGARIRDAVSAPYPRSPGYVQLNPVTVSNYKNLRIVVAFAEPNCQSCTKTATSSKVAVNDFIRIRYSLDGGPFVVAGQLMDSNLSAGGPGGSGYWAVDTSPLDSIPETNLTNAYQDVTCSFSGTGTTLRVQIVCDARYPELTFDNIRVIGDVDAAAKPTLASVGAAVSYTEGQASPVQVSSSLTVGYSDNSATNITGATVTVGGGFVANQDQLNYTNQGNISGSYNTGTGVLTLTGTASQAAYQAALRSITYSNANTTTLSSGTRQITFVVSGGSAQSNSPVQTVNLTSVLNGPAALPYTENFDTDGEGTRYYGNSFVRTATTSGFFRATTSPAYYGSTKIGDVTYTNWSGGYWFGENTKLINSTGTAVQLAPVNAAGVSGLKFVVAVGSSSTQGAGTAGAWDANDYFKLYYRANGGSWTEFGSFTTNATLNDGVLRRGGSADSVGVGTALRYFTFPLPAAAAVANLDFQLLQASDSDEELAFDNIRIVGQTTVNSIVRASTNPTNAATVNYTVTFGAVVTGLTAANFTLTTSGLSGASVGTPTQGSGNTWTVPVTTGTGNGTLTLNLNNDTGLSYDISSTLPFAGETYTIDKTAPVATINRQSPTGTATNATSVTFRVTFSEAVTGVSASSFALNTSSTSGTLASATSVGGSTTVYDVVVSGVSGNGTLGITLKSTGSGVTDAAGNPATGVTGPTYTIDNTAPTVTFTSTPPSPSNSTSATFAFTGSDGTGSGIASFQASINSGAYTTVSSPLTYSGLSDGTYTVQVRAIDNAGNVGSPASYTFTVDTTPPTVTLTSSTVANNGSTTTSPVSFTAQFSESVGSTFTIGDITVSSGSTVGNFAAGSAANSYTFTVTPSVGTVSVSIAAGVAQDAAGNSNTAATPNPYTFTYSLPAATVTSIARQTPAAAATATATVSYLVTFSAPVSGVTASNFNLTTTGISGATLTSVAPGTGSSATYTVTVNTGTGNGTLQLNVANASGITPSVTNTPYNGTSAVYTIVKSFNAGPQLVLRGAGSASGASSDVTAFVDGVQVVQNGTSTAVTNALQNGSFETNNLGSSDYLYPGNGLVASPWTFSSQAGVARIGGSGFAPAASGQGSFVGLLQSLSGNNSSVAQSLTVPTGTYQVNFVAAQRGNQGTSDQVVNVFLNNGTTDVFIGTIQPTSATTYAAFTSAAFSVAAPALTATVSTTSGSPTSTSPIPFSVSFSQSVGTTFIASDVTVGGGTVTSGSFSGSGSGPYAFTVTPTGSSSTVTVSLLANVANDANNTGNSLSNSVSVQYQQSVTAAPTLTSPANNSTTSSLPTFSGTAPAGSTVTIYLTMGSNAAQVIGTTTATGGNFSFTSATALAGGSYSAYATAQTSGAAVSANSNTNTFTVDATAPTVSSSNRQTPTAATTNATSLVFRVTFSEPVTGVDATDFTLTTTGTVSNSGRTVTAVSASVYDVLVSGVSGNGTVRLDLNASGTGIADAVGNPISGGYTSGQTYTIDQTAPVVTLSTTATSPTATSPIPFSATFSETVAGFSASGISVSNGTVTSGSLSGSGPYTFTVTPTGSGTVTVSILANAAQDAAGNGNIASNSVSVTYSSVTTWTAGAGTQDWFTAGNWSAGVPTASTDALIPAGVRFYPLVTAAGAVTRALTINSPGSVTLAIVGTLTVNGLLTNGGTITQSAGTLTVNGNMSMSGTISKSAGTISVTGSLTNTGTLTQSGGDFAVGNSLTNNTSGTVSQIGGTLSVSGDLTNNGTFTTTNAAGTSGGTVLLGGAAPDATSFILGSQAIRFWNLTMNAGGAQLATSAGASVRNVLTLNGNFAPNGNVFTLESASTGTALVVNNGTNVVTGTTTVQRYIDPSLNSGLGYRHYSAPVSTSTVADLSTPTGFTPIVNPAYNSAPAPTSLQPFPTVYGYDEQRVNLSNSMTAFDRGYFSPTALSDPLTVGRGYTVNIGASQLVDFVGTLNNGTLTLPLASTRDTNPDGGWQLLGNPYPAPLDYSRVAAADRTGLDAAIYVFSSTSQYGGQYRSYINNFGNPVLPVGQGFFTRVSTLRTSASMTFRNSQRLTTPNATTFQRQAETRPVVQLNLQGTGSPLIDEFYVYFEQGATDSFDRTFDAEKLSNPSGLNLSSSLSASQRLSIDGRGPLGIAQQVVPLAVGVPAAGTYSLAAAQLLNLSQVPVYLRDKQTGALIDLTQQPSYQFAVSNASTLITGRFELVFSPQQPLATVPAALAQQVLVYPNPAKGQVAIELPLTLSGQPVTATLVDAVGRAVREQVLPAGRSTHTLLLTDLATGVYALRLRTELGTVVRKLMLE